VGQYAELGKIEADDAIGPLDPDIEKAVLPGERFGVVPSARRQRAAVGPDHRCHQGVVDPGRTPVVVDDAAGQPIPLV
jgi:hypothetical protein